MKSTIFFTFTIILFALHTRLVGAGICNGKDFSKPAVCYAAEYPKVYNASKAVFRVSLRFEDMLLSHCTAWLLGCEGHVMTNKHCVDSQDFANDLVFELMAEGSECSNECTDGELPCAGSIRIDEPLSVIKTGSTDDFDYTLLRLPQKYRYLSTEIGYFQLRNGTVVKDELVFVPQHPLGYGKRIAMHGHNITEETRILDIDVSSHNKCGKFQVTHNADTASGASGSPVVSRTDFKVIALHHCSGCDTNLQANGAIPSEALISDLGLELPKCSIE